MTPWFQYILVNNGRRQWRGTIMVEKSPLLVMLRTQWFLVSDTYCYFKIKEHSQLRTILIDILERGQGLNNAIKDASDLVDAIKAVKGGTTTLEEAITAYETEMKPRGAKEVALSLEQALKARDKDTIKDSPIFKLGWQASKQASVETPTQAAS
jgi:hypothetical protein